MTFPQQYNISPWLTPVRVAAMTNVAGTYSNGPSNNGVGSTFTCASGVLTIDDVIVNIGDYVLLGGQSLSYQNGIYECTAQGAVGFLAVLQRRNDFQCIEQMKEGQYVSVGEGTVLGGAILTIIGPLPSLVGQPGSSNSLTFIVVASAGGGSGSGTVSPGTANQIAYYATTGSTVSGLTGANDGVLITDNTGVPSLLANSGTPGFVLTANSGAPPSWQAGGGGGGVTIIDGDAGSVTGSTVTFSGGSTGLTTNGSGTTLDLTGTLHLASGGTNANLTAAAGKIAYSTASALALSAAGSSGQLFQSAGTSAPVWTTATYPPTTTVNQLLYSSSANVVAGLSTLNNGVLVTSASGVPELLANSGTSGFVLTANFGAPPSWQAGGGGAFAYANGTELAVGGNGPLPSNGQNGVYFGTSITANDLFVGFGVGNTIDLGGANNVAAIGSTIGWTGSEPGNAFAVGNNIDYSGSSNSISIGNGVTNNCADSLAVGISINIGSAGGTSFAVGSTIAAPGNANFAFGNNITINNEGSWVINDGNSVVTDTATQQFNSAFQNGYRFFAGSGGFLSLSIDFALNIINSAGEADQSKLIVIPTSGGTVTVSAAHLHTILNPAGTLATLTISLPTVVSTQAIIDGQRLIISTTHIITALTVSSSGSDTVLGAPTTLPVGGRFEMIYDLGTTTWYPG